MAREPVILSFHESILHQSDIDLLKGPYWVNDSLISFYFEYLEKNVFHNNSSLLFVSPEVTQCIKMVPKSDIHTFLEPLNVRRKDFVFFPLNDNEAADAAGGTHWSLLVFSKPDMSLFHLDSSKGSNHNVAWQFANHLLSYASYLGNIDFIAKDCPQQNNGYDCGIHVMANAETIGHCAISHKSVASCKMTQFSAHEKRNEILRVIENLSRKHRSF